MILLTSATGKTSTAALRALMSSDIPIRVLVRDPQRLRPSDGVEVAVGFSRAFGEARVGAVSGCRAVPRSGSVEDALPQQIEVGAPVHLPLEQFRPVDLVG